MLFEITCSPTRTCDDQELGGPIDDVKAAALDVAKKVASSGFDLNEYENPFADTTEE